MEWHTHFAPAIFGQVKSGGGNSAKKKPASGIRSIGARSHDRHREILFAEKPFVAGVSVPAQPWWLTPEWWMCAVVFLLLAFVLLPQRFHWNDMMLWRNWALQIQQHGLAAVYYTNTDYMPLFHYVLWLYARLQPDAASITAHMHLLKWFPLTFDFLGATLLFRWLRPGSGAHRANAVLVLLFTMLNVGYLYNSLLWGQADSVYMVLVTSSALAALRRRASISIALFVLALLFKLQSVIFLPFIGLLLLPHFVQRFSLRYVALWALAFVLPLVVVLLPFRHHLEHIAYLALHAGERFPYASMNAFNLWYLLIDGEARYVPDTLLFHGFTYRQIGLGLFFIFSFIVLWPLCRASLQAIRQRTLLHWSPDKIMLTGALLPLTFFLWPTQMHERYALASFLFMAAYSLRSRHYLPFIIFSAATLLNLEAVLQAFNLPDYDWFIFNREFIALLYFFVYGSLLYRLYQREHNSPRKRPTAAAQKG